MKDGVRIAVVGTGAIAQLTHIPVLAKMRGASLVALCDNDGAKARALADGMGLKLPHGSAGGGSDGNFTGAAGIATLAAPLAAHELFDPNAVKVVCAADGRALYFSRATIPWDRDRFARGEREPDPALPYWRHIGLYAYRAGVLRAYPRLAPSPLERAEALEQLRALWHGIAIRVLFTDRWAVRVDVRDHIFSYDLLGVRQNTQNLELTTGFAYYF